MDMNRQLMVIGVIFDRRTVGTGELRYYFFGQKNSRDRRATLLFFRTEELVCFLTEEQKDIRAAQLSLDRRTVETVEEV